MNIPNKKLPFKGAFLNFVAELGRNQNLFYINFCVNPRLNDKISNMSELAGQDASFVINRRWLSNPNMDLTNLRIPENLLGKKVLELFSGSEKNSMKRDIEFRGGQYFSLDKNREISGGKHV